MRALKQLVTVTLVGLYTIPQRLSSSIVAVVGIAGVVVVLVAVLSIGEGFKAAMVNAGHTDRAIVMRSGADSEMSSGLSGPETELIDREWRLRVQQLLSSLNAEQRAVIELSYYHGYAYKDIAAVLGCPIATVKTRMFHARRKLREMLIAHGQEPTQDAVLPLR